MHISAILLAAGRGQRLHSKVSKPLIALNGKPLIMYSLCVLNSHPLIDELIVVANDDNAGAIERHIRRYGIGNVRSIVKGGRRRQDSVRNGLKNVAKNAELVVIHDGARPFLTPGLISAVIKEACASGAAISGVPVKATIKEAQRKKFVKKTLDRAKLWEIQTPQAFRRELIVRAYGACSRLEATDDAMLVERLGAAVAIVTGSYNNIKITTPEDLIVAKAILRSV